MFREKFNWLLIIQEKTLKDHIQIVENLQLRLDTNLQIAMRDSTAQYDFYQVYNLGIGSDNIVTKIGRFQESELEYMRNESFYESRKNLTNVLLRIGSKVSKTVSN